MPYTYAHPHPAVAVDIALFADGRDGPQILLIRRAEAPFEGCWALPGGFVEIDEDLDTAAARELAEETGIRGIRLDQLYAFGQPDRDPRERVISVAYTGLVQAADTTVKAASDAADVRWFALDSLPALAFDHAEIIAMVRARLAVTDRTPG